MARIAAGLGTPPLPWQQQLLDVALEIDEESGALAYREVVVTVPRQQGKTTLILAVEADVCVNRAPATVVYTAQTGSAARKKLLQDHVPQMKASELGPLVNRVVSTMGGETVYWSTGSRIELAANTESAGHGGVISLAVLDETFHDVDDRREQALLPGMLTKPDAQLWVVSTQGKESSYYLNRKCELGRQAATEDSGRGICYLEYSADPDADPYDPATWWSCMPSLGHTIHVEAVEHMAQSMDPAEFRRAALNLKDAADVESPIRPGWWSDCQDSTVSPSEGLVLGVEAAVDHSASALVIADEMGRVEVVDYRLGTSWLPERAAQIVEAHGCRVVLDPRGPGRRFVQPLHRLKVHVEELSSGEVAAAAMTFVERVKDADLFVRPHSALDDAVAAARKRWSGDQWYWARKSVGCDVSPLVAASLAVLMAGEPAPEIVTRAPRLHAGAKDSATSTALAAIREEKARAKAQLAGRR